LPNPSTRRQSTIVGIVSSAWDRSRSAMSQQRLDLPGHEHVRVLAGGRLEVGDPVEQGRDHVPVVGRQRGDHVGLRDLHVLEHPEQLLVELGDEVGRRSLIRWASSRASWSASDVIAAAVPLA
jgi:hypothetical protein